MKIYLSSKVPFEGFVVGYFYINQQVSHIFTFQQKARKLKVTF